MDFVSCENLFIDLFIMLLLEEYKSHFSRQDDLGHLLRCQRKMSSPLLPFQADAWFPHVILLDAAYERLVLYQLPHLSMDIKIRPHHHCPFYFLLWELETNFGHTILLSSV
jgi:hypothetical protein